MEEPIKRPKLLKIAGVTLLAIAVELVTAWFGRVFYRIACVAIGVGVGLTVGLLTDFQTGFFSGFLAWILASLVLLLVPVLIDLPWPESESDISEKEMKETFTRIVN